MKRNYYPSLFSMTFPIFLATYLVLVCVGVPIHSTTHSIQPYFCLAHKTYCGYELWRLGFEAAYYSNNLYPCNISVDKIDYDCPGGYVDENDISFCRKGCVNRNWWVNASIALGGEPNTKLDPQNLYTCGEDGSTIALKTICLRCISKPGADSFCLRECNDTNNFTGSTLEYYGSSPLAQVLGPPSLPDWEKFGGGYRWIMRDGIHRCTNMGNGSKQHTETGFPNLCYNRPWQFGDRRCAKRCEVGRKYCWHALELAFGPMHMETIPNIGWIRWLDRVQTLDRKTIFSCTNGTPEGMINNGPCTGQCLAWESGDSCGEGCQEGRRYCGHELSLLDGWTNANNINNNTVYVCDNSSSLSSFSVVEECISGICNNSLCVDACVIGKHYCDHDISKTSKLRPWPASSAKKTYLYFCRNSSALEFAHSCSFKCLHGECVPGCRWNYLYCGDELGRMGFQNVDESVLYRCRDSGSVVPVGSCPSLTSANPFPTASNIEIIVPVFPTPTPSVHPQSPFEEYSRDTACSVCTLVSSLLQRVVEFVTSVSGHVKGLGERLLT